MLADSIGTRARGRAIMPLDEQEQVWQSESFVDEWIDSDATHDHDRRPQLRWAASLLPLSCTEPVRVLDVGGGYGVFAGQVLAEYPNATVCVQDFSVPMLDKARDRLAEYPGRVEYQLSDLTDPDWFAGLDVPFDAVVSSFAIHTLLIGKAIRSVYSAVHGLLRPGGWFFNLDFVLDVLTLPPDAPQISIYSRAFPDWQERDHPAVPGMPGLTDQLNWLTEAGFDGVDCVRKELAEVFLIAHRPA
jgi:tRNA (cmo5U34)-methyltransferase